MRRSSPDKRLCSIPGVSTFHGIRVLYMYIYTADIHIQDTYTMTTPGNREPDKQRQKLGRVFAHPPLLVIEGMLKNVY